jgi:F0F1-type ATP synthase delta subunit
MDGHLMNKKLSNLSHISEERWKKLRKYFEDNSLSLQDRCSLLNEITQHKDTEKDVKYSE